MKKNIFTLTLFILFTVPLHANADQGTQVVPTVSSQDIVRINSLLEQITELTKIVESLQQQLALLNAAPQIPDLEGYVFEKDLELGDRDVEVLLLQKALNEVGFTVSLTGGGSLGNETNYFGKKTEDAVKRFQATYANLILHPAGYFLPTGEVDVYTRNILNRATAQMVSGSGQISTVTQGTSPYITRLTPSSGPNGSRVTITGGNFTTTGNTVNTTYGVFENVPSVDNESLSIILFFQSIEDMLSIPSGENLESLFEGESATFSGAGNSTGNDLSSLGAHVQLSGNFPPVPVSVRIENSNGLSNVVTFSIEI